MAQLEVPAINVAACSGWSELDRSLYNKLPFYIAKMQLEHRKTWALWSKLVGKKRWTANMGDTLVTVSKEPSPHLRQFAFPNLIADMPKKDVIALKERKAAAKVRWHQFESPVFNFLPSFQDFLTDHVDRTIEDISEKQIRFEDVFIRGHIFHQSPKVFVCNGGGGDGPLVTAPQGDGDDAGLTGKSTAWLQGILPTIGNPGNLSVINIALMASIMETDLRILPFKGTLTPGGDSAPLNGKYLLVCSGEAYNAFQFDPWILSNKDHNLNIINNGFKGDLFGRVTCRLEDMPIRMKADGTFPAPEVSEVNPGAENYGESVPNPAYVTAPFEVAFMVGGHTGYKSIDVGPPPKHFASSKMPKGWGDMSWNGEIIITKNVLVPCPSGDTVIQETNKYGKYLQLISEVTYGIIGDQKRSILPIIFKRKRVGDDA
jgi:hypothetical protein